MTTSSNRRTVITTLALCVTLVSAISVVISAQTPQASPNANDAALKRIRESTQAKLDQLHAAAGFPGATIGFVLADGRSGSVSTGVSDLATKRPLVPTDLMLAGSIGKTFVAAVMIQLAQEGKVNLDYSIESRSMRPVFTAADRQRPHLKFLNHSSFLSPADDDNFTKPCPPI